MSNQGRTEAKIEPKIIGKEMDTNPIDSKMAIHCSQWVNKSGIEKDPDGWVRSFRTCNFTQREILTGVYAKGYGFAPVWNGSLIGSTGDTVFATSQSIWVDIDKNNIPIDRLVTNPFISAFASFAYSTSSSTPSAPKSRVVFFLDNPVTDALLYRQLIETLWAEITKSNRVCDDFVIALDPSCKDSCRKYCGSRNAHSWWVNVNYKNETGWGVNGWAITPLDILLTENTARLAAIENDRLDKERERIERAAIAAQEAVFIKFDGNYGNYIIKCLENAENAVATAPSGLTHNTLARQAYSLGGFFDADWLPYASRPTEQQVYDRLFSAYRKTDGSGNDKEVADTIGSGIAKGRLEVRQPPEDRDIVVKTPNAITGIHYDKR